MLSYFEVCSVRVALELTRGNDDYRHHQETGECQLPREQEEKDNGEHDQQRRGNELQQTPLDEFGHRFDVCGHACHENARLVAIEESQRLTLDVIEYSDSKRTQESFPRAIDEDVLLTGRQIRGGNNNDVHNHSISKNRSVVSIDAVIDPVPHKYRSQQHTHGGDCSEDEGPADGLLERHRHSRGSPEDLLCLVTVQAIVFSDRIHPEHQSPPTGAAGDGGVLTVAAPLSRSSAASIAANTFR